MQRRLEAIERKKTLKKQQAGIPFGKLPDRRNTVILQNNTFMGKHDSDGKVQSQDSLDSIIDSIESSIAT